MLLLEDHNLPDELAASAIFRIHQEDTKEFLDPLNAMHKDKEKRKKAMSGYPHSPSLSHFYSYYSCTMFNMAP